MANGSALSCPISFDELPGPPREWFADLVNSIPRAHDLPSAINALRAISNVVQVLTNNMSARNNFSIRGSVSISINDNIPGGEKTTIPGETLGKFPPSNWFEDTRNTKTQRFENPDNTDQFVEVDVITSLTFLNEDTGHTLVYTGQL